ncbi:thiosulfate oxidation carrier complex protein SoxZ [Ideonella sp. A 288]|uniref:thiosulfate oxidation carrier complex protein SoxZ n=1 Tax=Ideonella sp. A 288 TaxID=1962181 RepID=UPI000B4AC06B|nr:thiosulfate oxidation carrier complex protein SoxZ [Ideonella sp. A 288]
MARSLIHLPPTPRRGDVIEVRVTLAHPMETGYRSDDLGRPLPRNIVTQFDCRYGERTVFSARLYPAVAANPFVAFFLRVEASGTLTFTWEGDHGFRQTETVALNVA